MVKGVAIIPARSGSKRIPKKNIIDFFGKPMIAWTIEAALQSNQFEKVYVSTDSEEIADIAREYGAEVPFLRDAYTDDYSTVSDVVYDFLVKLESRKNEFYDFVAQLMPNCPIRSDEDIKKTLKEFLSKNTDFLISGFKFGWMNPYWARRIHSDQSVEPIFEKHIEKRSQDLPNLYCPTGAIWIAKVDKFKKEKTFYGRKYQMHVIDWKSAVDIDDYADLEMAKATFLIKKQNKDVQN